jgi:hypothetical protein
MSYGAEQSVEVSTEINISTTQMVFKLPADLTQWQAVTTAYMEPVLTTPELKSLWQKLVDLTMPTDGQFNPTMDVTRREATIVRSFEALESAHEDARVIYLEQLLARHHIYIQK